MSWDEGFADRYDEWAAHMTEDVAFYVGLARQADGPLVELAVGNGRVAIPVAQATGRPVIGIDSSPAMLAQARAGAAAAGVRLALREGDMRDLALDEPAALIYCPFRALLHLPTWADRRRTFERVAAALRPGGRFAWEAFAFDHQLAVRYDGVHQAEPVPHTVRYAVGDNRVDLVRDDGARASAWWATKNEWLGLIDVAGLELEALYGGFAGEPFTEDSREYVFVTRAPGGLGLPGHLRKGSISMADRAGLPFGDTADFEAADRGLVDVGDPVVRNEAGEVVWDNGSYASFLVGDAPDTVHPSLWRQSTLVARQGLYKVTDGIYQVRGYDLSNLSVIEGEVGIIVIDPLISTQTAAAALALYRKHRGNRPVVAVIHTHSHLDHFGGVKGVTSQQDVDAGKVQIIAPEGFVEHAIAENVYAGTAMARRAGYMYGAALARGPRGGVGAGLGQTTSTGTVTLINPTVTITTTGQELTVDGVRMIFQMAPGTEAPAEMHFYFPDQRALCMAENATHTLHNLLTLRGALVRDPHVWAGYLTEAIELFAGRSDVVFASHHWPTWGTENIVEFLGLQRDLYAYLHDQTLRLLNQGYTGPEIAEMIELPPALEQAWSAHGYYGSVSHNVKAIYQRYMGWYDGNPARLWQHPPQEKAKRYVEFMGGADEVVAKARRSFAAGDLRWAAEVLDHVVFADPGHAEAKALLADVFDQLGYGAENGTWRCEFLSAAMELRTGNFGTPAASGSVDIVSQLSPEMLFDAVAIQVNGPAAWDLDLAIRWDLPDRGASYRTTLRNGVLTYVKDSDKPVGLTLTVPAAALLPLALGNLEAARRNGLTADGDESQLASLFGVLQPGNPNFNIIEP